jgi:hypothetical protein
VSTDLRTALAELADSAAPALEALPPARRAELARARARGIRRRRIAARSLGALAVAALAVGVVRVAPTGAVQPAHPPFQGTDQFAPTVLDRTLLSTAAVEVDGEAVHLQVTPPDADVQVRFFCSRSAPVQLRVSIDGGSPAYVSGCKDTTQSSSRDGEDWAHLGLRPGQPLRLTLSASSTGALSDAELETPTWAFVGVYATPASALPGRPATVPGTAGLRRVGMVVLDADTITRQPVLQVPASRTLFYAASCAGPADGLEYMIHVGDQMLAGGSCRAEGPPVVLSFDGVPSQDGDVVARVFLSANHGQDPQDRVPGPGAQVVVSFYVRATE